ncbi:hypothetical protein SUGI_0222570 [Cryptomeria japonica]|uniref:condensin-2 complex subunit H2 isoform X2 n=1 Tax=Cryptomeria japonica TaxID=3369 RepID=UPI002408ECF2|nr:condensin-2 complex subunit H2 isoform X2 [Cryptomeria japonica]GLJ13929.1 hypothetical protein SUGI_0222570 [Cryptomeria japonica]
MADRYEHGGFPKMRNDKEYLEGEGDEEGEGERESLLRRLVQLLQPNNRDLAANWAVDVSAELQNYLNHLAVTSLFQDGSGSSSLNFAQAALLIQGSIQIYSRKVEYLYSLVVQALEFIAQKKQVQQEKGSVQADGNDVDVLEEEGEEEFLNLDDVEEETNIDIDDEGFEASALTPVTKPPASLLVLEGEGADVAGDAGELAAYQIATSSLHRDFLLLDPCDADAVDKLLNNAFSKGTPSQPSGSVRHRTPRTPRNEFSTPGKRVASTQKSGLSKGNSIVKGPSFDDVAYGQGTIANCNQSIFDTQDLGNDGTNNFDTPHIDINTNTFGGPADPEDDFSEEEDDPWKPLNPHECGDLPVKPYRRGLLNKRQKAKESTQVRSALEFPLARRFGTVCPGFQNVSESWKHGCHGKQDSQSPPIYEKLRSSFGLNEKTPFHASGVGDDGVDGDDGDESFGFRDDGIQDDAAFEDHVGASGNDFVDMDIPVKFSNGDNLAGLDGATYHEKDLDGGGNFEDLCFAHMDAVLRNFSEKQTDLANRVSSWKQKIEKNLEEQDCHPPFDIHIYGERVLDQFSSDQGVGDQKSFTELVSGKEKHEVARTFAALLQLVNNGNVDLDKGMLTGQSFCFTAEKPFFVRLLSSSRRHKEMLKYRAPSMASPTVKVSKKSKNKSPLDHQAGIKIIENKDSSNGSPESGRSNKLLSSKRKNGSRQRLESSKRLETPNNGNYSAGTSRKVLGSGSGFTPERKRRRRLLSVRPLEVQVGR